MHGRSTSLSLVLALSLAACSDDTIGPTPSEFDELCGENEPFHLLPLDPGQRPDYVDTRVFAERYIIWLRFGDASDNYTTEIWSVGRCGEDPTHLATGTLSWMRGGVDPYPPDIPFICDESNQRTLALDPSGILPPNEVFETHHDCLGWAHPAGVLTILGAGNTGALVLQPWPDDPLTETAEQIVLVDEVKAHAFPTTDLFFHPYDVLSVSENDVLAITGADKLIAVSLDDFSVNVLADDVREFERGDRYILYQGTEITNDDPEWPEGPIFLLDRETGESTQLDETALAYTVVPRGLPVESLGLLHYRVAPYGIENADRWVRLDTLESYPGPDGLQPIRAIDDTRMVLFRYFSDVYVLDISTGGLTLIDDGPSTLTGFGESLTILRGDGDALLDISYDGEVRTLARHVSGDWTRTMLSGGRIVTPYAVRDDDIGDLIVVDPDTLDERYIDHDIRSWSVRTHAEAPSTTELEIVSYMVIDADPDRHGIWLAKPAK